MNTKTKTSAPRIAEQGAPELAAVEVENLNRGTFLVRGVLAAGALYGAASVTPLVRSRSRSARRSTTASSA